MSGKSNHGLFISVAVGYLGPIAPVLGSQYFLFGDLIVITIGPTAVHAFSDAEEFFRGELGTCPRGIEVWPKASQVIAPVLYRIDDVFGGMPFNGDDTSQSGGEQLSVALCLIRFVCTESPDSSVIFKRGAWIDARRIGGAFHLLTIVGWCTEGYIQVAVGIESNGFGDMFVATVGVVIDNDGLGDGVGKELSGNELAAIDDKLGAVIDIPVVNAHSRTVRSVRRIISEGYDKVGSSVARSIAQSYVSSFAGESGFNVDVSVVAYRDVSGSSAEAVDDNKGFKAVGQKQSTIVGITGRKLVRGGALPFRCQRGDDREQGGSSFEERSHSANCKPVPSVLSIPFNSVNPDARGTSGTLIAVLPVFFGSEAVEVVYDASVAEREFAGQLAVADDFLTRDIDEPELSFLQTENGDVGGCARAEVAKFVAMNDLCRRPGGGADHFRKG